MSLRALYERFLSSPNPLHLSENASLHYVTTLTTLTQQGSIIRHLESQNKNIVRKKAEKVITSIEGNGSLALEVDTTLEFVEHGGAYLPGLDNFIVDRIVTLPVTHIVHFDRDQKINQIRLSWDQGSLLQQVEVIGTRGKNWPITGGKEQIKLITSSSSSVGTGAVAADNGRGRSQQLTQTPPRNQSPTKRYIKDPHASLDIFSPPQDDENRRPTTADSETVALRASAKPPPREYNEIFAAGHEDHAPSPNGSPNKAFKENVVPPKGAGARRFETSRLFEEDQDFKEPKIYKTNPARYNHFDIGDAEDDDPMQYKPESKVEKDQKHVPLVARHQKSASHWEFEDFSTPEKVVPRSRKEDQTHFSLDDQARGQGGPDHAQNAKGRKDMESHFELLDAGTPLPPHGAQPKPRKDAEHHFDFRDDPTPAPRRIIARTKAAEGIYHNPLEDEDDDDQFRKPALATITNNAGRKKDFESHWDTTDDSPSYQQASKKPLGQNKAKAVESMASHWDDFDESTEAAKKPAPAKNYRGLTSSWSFGD